MTIAENNIKAVASIALIVGLAATLRLFFARDGFNEDELFQVTLINEALPHFFIAIARLDQHPFFHFLQLKLWGLFSSSDDWLLLNSVFWHVVSCLAIFHVGRAWRGVSVGVVASAIYALIPQVVGQSATLRMYAMIPALAIGVWWLNLTVLDTRQQPWWRWLLVVVVELCLAYSHAIGFYFVAWISLAAAMQVYFSKVRPELPWKRWFMAQTIAVMLIAPLILSALVRISMPGQSDAGGNNDPGNPISHWGGMVSGWGFEWQPGLVLGFLFYLGTVLLGLRLNATRALSIFVLIGPYAFAALMAIILAPMYKTPVYSAMIMPFACLVFAAGALDLRPSLRLLLVAPVMLVLAIAVFPATERYAHFASPYKPVAEELARRVEPGDVVIAAKPYVYWAVMRYSVGNNWGSPLEILPALSGSWLGLIERLGPTLSTRLKLIPANNHVVNRDVTYVIGDDARRESEKSRRVWLVQRTSYPIPVRLAVGFVKVNTVGTFGNRQEIVELYLFERDDSKSQMLKDSRSGS